MANMVTRKQPHRVSDMTTDELQAMMETVIDRKMSEWVSDPHVARRRAEIVANVHTTRRAYRAGKVRRGTIRDLLSDRI